MLIESIIRRTRNGVRGSRISVGGKTFKFVPKDPTDEDSPHVCEIDDKVAANKPIIARLLSITEGFRIYDEVLSHQKADEPVPEPVIGVGTVQEGVPDEAPLPKYDGPAIELPDFTKMTGKKEVIQWAATNLPGLAINPKLPEGRIVQLIKQYVAPENRG
jgi:hypothetical protein